jgi:PIN domain nuclease of toxin-antitoxin system
MKILVDTHYLLWSFVDTKRIPPKIYDKLLDEENEVFYSQVSLWEISIKYNLGKLIIDNKDPEILYDEIENSYFNCRRMENEELITFYKLPMEHKDPFDRILIWQSIKSDYHFFTVDSEMEKYKKYGLKILK